MFGDEIISVSVEESCEVHARIGWQALTRKEHMTTGDYMLITGTDFKDNEIEIICEDFGFMGIPCIKAEIGNSVELGIRYLGKLCSLKVLSKEHTEHRRILGIFFIYFGKADSRISRARIDLQSFSALKAAHL